MVQKVEKFHVEPGQLVSKASLAMILVGWPQSGDQPGEAASGTASLYLKPGQAQEYLKGRESRGTDWGRSLSSLGNKVLESDTGLAAFRSGTQGLVVAPPFPVTENQVVEVWDPAPLLDLMEKERTLGVVLLRLGRFSAAVYKGHSLVSSKTDARYVKGRHAAGGTSQKRFERIRQGQINRIYDKACQAVEAQLGPYDGRLDFIVLGGERTTLNGFLKSCDFLRRRQDIIQGRRLNVRDPKRDTLEKVGDMLWESRVWPLSW